MIHLLIDDRHDTLPPGGGVPGRRVETLAGVTPHPAGVPIPDSDVPLFSFLRSTVGLPTGDPRWWPERLVRRPRGFASWSDPVPAGGQPPATPRPVLALLRETVGDSGEFAPLNQALLERALQALRGLDATPQFAPAR
jgi:hypothetical protein